MGCVNSTAADEDLQVQKVSSKVKKPEDKASIAVQFERRASSSSSSSSSTFSKPIDDSSSSRSSCGTSSETDDSPLASETSKKQQASFESLVSEGEIADVSNDEQDACGVLSDSTMEEDHKLSPAAEESTNENKKEAGSSTSPRETILSRMGPALRRVASFNGRLGFGGKSPVSAAEAEDKPSRLAKLQRRKSVAGILRRSNSEPDDAPGKLFLRRYSMYDIPVISEEEPLQDKWQFPDGWQPSGKLERSLSALEHNPSGKLDTWQLFDRSTSYGEAAFRAREIAGLRMIKEDKSVGDAFVRVTSGQGDVWAVKLVEVSEGNNAGALGVEELPPFPVRSLAKRSGKKKGKESAEAGTETIDVSKLMEGLEIDEGEASGSHSEEVVVDDVRQEKEEMHEAEAAYASGEAASQPRRAMEVNEGAAVKKVVPSLIRERPTRVWRVPEGSSDSPVRTAIALFEKDKAGGEEGLSAEGVPTQADAPAAEEPRAPMAEWPSTSTDVQASSTTLKKYQEEKNLRIVVQNPISVEVVDSPGLEGGTSAEVVADSTENTAKSISQERLSERASKIALLDAVLRAQDAAVAGGWGADVKGDLRLKNRGEHLSRLLQQFGGPGLLSSEALTGTMFSPSSSVSSGAIQTPSPAGKSTGSGSGILLRHRSPWESEDLPSEERAAGSGKEPGVEVDGEEDLFFDPDLLEIYEAAFEEYSPEEWLASSSPQPRRRSLEVWVRAVERAQSRKEGESPDGTVTIGRKLFGDEESSGSPLPPGLAEKGAANAMPEMSKIDEDVAGEAQAVAEITTSAS